MDTNGSEDREYTPDLADEPGWDLGIEDDAAPVLAAVARQLKLSREAAGLKHAEFGALIGYGENLVYKVEAGKRIPRPEYLDRADEVLDAGGRIAAMKEDVALARYPKKVRDLARWEGKAIELGAYETHNVHGLLQTEEFTHALLSMRRPLLIEEIIERGVAARMARQDVLVRNAGPVVSFVQEEATLRRPIGGRAVLRRQLERMLEIGELRNVEIQVMPLDREDHGGMAGAFQILKLKDGTTVGRVEVQRFTRLVSEPCEVQALEIQYGIVRAQALTPRESLAFIDKLRGE
jgi:transcriptional regulator with XRE-family HTH domain